MTTLSDNDQSENDDSEDDEAFLARFDNKWLVPRDCTAPSCINGLGERRFVYGGVIPCIVWCTSIYIQNICWFWQFYFSAVKWSNNIVHAKFSWLFVWIISEKVKSILCEKDCDLGEIDTNCCLSTTIYYKGCKN